MAGLEANIYAAVSITWAAALIALILRIFARRMTKQMWWFDDYCCVSAFVFASTYNGIVIEWAAKWHLGQYLDDSSAEVKREEILRHNRRLFLVCEYCYTFSIASSKFTVLILYWRLFKLSSIRRPIQIMFAVCLIWLLLRTLVVSLQCIPLEYFWDKSVEGHCDINEAQSFFGAVLAHFIMDIIILILPILEVGKLRLRLGQKLATIGLFLIGAVVCLASVFVLIGSVTYDKKTTEMSYDVATNIIWADVEVNVAIVCSCFPLLRPVFRLILPRSFLSSEDSSHPISRTTHSHAIKLTTIRTNKEKEVDESSSTHQLADSEQGFGDGPEAIQSVISSRMRSSRGYSSGERDLAGIHVQNDMVIEVEVLGRTCHLRR